MVSKEEILKKGSVEVRVKISGIYKRIEFKVEREKTPWGMVPFCVSSYPVPATELIRVAEELQLPVKCKGMKVFPKGKSAQDFAEKEPSKKKGLAHDRVLGLEPSVSEEEEEEESEDEEERMPVEDSEPDGKAEEPEGEEEEEEKTPEGDEGPQGPEPQKEDEIEIEGSMGEEKKEEKLQEKPKKKIFTGILSEGILS